MNLPFICSENDSESGVNLVIASEECSPLNLVRVDGHGIDSNHSMKSEDLRSHTAVQISKQARELCVSVGSDERLKIMDEINNCNYLTTIAATTTVSTAAGVDDIQRLSPFFVSTINQQNLEHSLPDKYVLYRKFQESLSRVAIPCGSKSSLNLKVDNTEVTGRCQRPNSTPPKLLMVNSTSDDDLWTSSDADNCLARPSSARDSNTQMSMADHEDPVDGSTYRNHYASYSCCDDIDADTELLLVNATKPSTTLITSPSSNQSHKACLAQGGSFLQQLLSDEPHRRDVDAVKRNVVAHPRSEATNGNNPMVALETVNQNLTSNNVLTVSMALQSHDRSHILTKTMTTNQFIAMKPLSTPSHSVSLAATTITATTVVTATTSMEKLSKPSLQQQPQQNLMQSSNFKGTTSTIQLQPLAVKIITSSQDPSVRICEGAVSTAYNDALIAKDTGLLRYAKGGSSGNFRPILPAKVCNRGAHSPPRTSINARGTLTISSNHSSQLLARPIHAASALRGDNAVAGAVSRVHRTYGTMTVNPHDTTSTTYSRTWLRGRLGHRYHRGSRCGGSTLSRMHCSLGVGHVMQEGGLVSSRLPAPQLVGMRRPQQSNEDSNMCNIPVSTVAGSGGGAVIPSTIVTTTAITNSSSGNSGSSCSSTTTTITAAVNHSNCMTTTVTLPPVGSVGTKVPDTSQLLPSDCNVGRIGQRNQQTRDRPRKDHQHRKKLSALAVGGGGSVLNTTDASKLVIPSQVVQLQATAHSQVTCAEENEMVPYKRRHDEHSTPKDLNNHSSSHNDRDGYDAVAAKRQSLDAPVQGDLLLPVELDHPRVKAFVDNDGSVKDAFGDGEDTKAMAGRSCFDGDKGLNKEPSRSKHRKKRGRLKSSSNRATVVTVSPSLVKKRRSSETVTSLVIADPTDSAPATTTMTTARTPTTTPTTTDSAFTTPELEVVDKAKQLEDYHQSMRSLYDIWHNDLQHQRECGVQRQVRVHRLQDYLIYESNMPFPCTGGRDLVRMVLQDIDVDSVMRWAADCGVNSNASRHLAQDVVEDPLEASGMVSTVPAASSTTTTTTSSPVMMTVSTSSDFINSSGTQDGSLVSFSTEPMRQHNLPLVSCNSSPSKEQHHVTESTENRVIYMNLSNPLKPFREWSSSEVCDVIGQLPCIADSPGVAQRLRSVCSRDDLDGEAFAFMSSSSLHMGNPLKLKPAAAIRIHQFVQLLVKHFPPVSGKPGNDGSVTDSNPLTMWYDDDRGSHALSFRWD